MTALRHISALVLGFAIALPVMADRVDHYKGIPSETLSEALINFREYNQLLKQRLSGDLTDEDLAAIHELSYTLENALEKINQDLADLADTLEEVHVASENFDRKALEAPARKYLEVVETLEASRDQ